MSFDPNQRAVRANETLETLVKQQTTVLEKVLEKLDEIAGILVEGNDTIIDQNADIKRKIDDANVNLGHVINAVEAGN